MTRLGLRSLVDRTIDAGIHGLVPCGSTGEFSTLTRTERERVVEVVIEQAAGRVPVVPHTGACSTREAIGLSQHAERTGAAAIMVVNTLLRAVFDRRDQTLLRRYRGFSVDSGDGL